MKKSAFKTVASLNNWIFFFIKKNHNQQYLKSFSENKKVMVSQNTFEYDRKI